MGAPDRGSTATESRSRRTASRKAANMFMLEKPQAAMDTAGTASSKTSFNFSKAASNCASGIVSG